MTQIKFFVTSPTKNGRVPVNGSITFTPSAAQILEGDPAELVLPMPFTEPLVDGLLTVDLAPNTDGLWSWQIKFEIVNLTLPIEYVFVPDSVTPIDYPTLTKVDPATLEPIVDVDPIWVAMANSTVTSGLIDGEGHLILERTDGTQKDAGKIVDLRTFGDLYKPMSQELFPASLLGVGGVTCDQNVPTYTAQTAATWGDIEKVARLHGALNLVSLDGGGTGSNMLDGSFARAAYDLEFWVDGSKVTLMLNTYGGDYHVHINDMPVTRDPQKITVAGAYFLHIPFAEAGLYKVRVTLGAIDLFQLIHEAKETVYPAAERFNLGVLADSWGQGSTGYYGGAIPHWIGAETGFGIWRNCQGGTGYHNVTVPGQDFTPYGSPERIEAMTLQGLDALLIYGSFNDGNQTSETLVADAVATYRTIGDAMPDLPIIVAGWQPYFNGDTTADAISNAILAAAALEPNVVGTIDWRLGRGQGGWITGTGTIAEPSGTGTGDVLIHSIADPHPNLRANKMLGRRLASEMAPFHLL